MTSFYFRLEVDLFIYLFFEMICTHLKNIWIKEPSHVEDSKSTFSVPNIPLTSTFFTSVCFDTYSCMKSLWNFLLFRVESPQRSQWRRRMKLWVSDRFEVSYRGDALWRSVSCHQDDLPRLTLEYLCMCKHARTTHRTHTSAQASVSDFPSSAVCVTRYKHAQTHRLPRKI